MNPGTGRSHAYLDTGRRMMRRRARAVLWSWRYGTHPLRTDSRFSMEALVGTLRGANGETYSFDEVRRIRELCRARDRRAPDERTHGSTRVEDAYFLYLLVRKLRPQTIFEVGTLIGASASTMAHAQLENGGGIVYTVDGDYAGFEPLPAHRIRCFPGRRSYEALETLRRENQRIDLVFVDGNIGRRDLELLSALASPDLAVATHDYKPPLDKGIRNAWTISRHLASAGRSVWVLPERQGVGYATGDGIFVNSSVAVLLSESAVRRLCAHPSAV